MSSGAALPEGEQRLLNALMKNNVDEVRRAIDRADVNYKFPKGQTFLFVAIRTGIPEIVQALLDKGADADVADQNGTTVLMASTDINVSHDILRMIVKEARSTIDAKDKLGQSALSRSINVRNKEAVRVLLEAGADPFIMKGQQSMEQLIENIFIGSTEKEEMLGLLRAARAKVSSASAAVAPSASAAVVPSALASSALAPSAQAPSASVVSVDVQPDAKSEGTPQPKIELKSDEIDVVCDAVTAQPYRQGLYSRLYMDFSVTQMQAKVGTSTLGDSIVDYFFPDPRQSLQALMAQAPLGEGQASMVWAMYLSPESAGRIMSIAWGSKSIQSWNNQCMRRTQPGPFVPGMRLDGPSAAVASAQPFETLAVPLSKVQHVYQVKGSPSVRLVFKLSFANPTVCDARVDRFVITYVPPQMFWYKPPQPSVIEMLSFFLVNNLVAPYCPNVTALGVCGPISRDLGSLPPNVETFREKVIGKGNTSYAMAKVEEYLPGVTMYEFLTNSEYRQLRETMTPRDWMSILWQTVMVHMTLLINAGIVHGDPHTDNIVLHIMNEPMSIEYEYAEEDVVLRTMPSRFLVQRIDWSDSFPVKSMSMFDRRAFLGGRYLFFGFQSRHARKLLNDREKYSSMPMCTSPATNDIIEIMMLYRLFLVKERPIAQEKTLNYIIKMTEQILSACRVYDSVQLDLNNSPKEEALRLAERMLVDEGGWNVPDRWFEINNTHLAAMINHLKTQLPKTYLDASYERTAKVTLKNFPLSREPSETISHMMKSTGVIPLIQINGAQTVQDKYGTKLLEMFDQVQSDLVPETFRVFVLLNNQIRAKVAPTGKVQQVMDNMRRLLSLVKTRPPVFDSFVQRTDEWNKIIFHGMSILMWKQLANAAARLAGVEYPFDIDRSKYIQMKT